MTDPHDTPRPLAYAGTELDSRRQSRLAVAAFLVALVLVPGCLALQAFAMQRNLVRHETICPSCGGWGASAAVGLTALLLIGTVVILVRTIRLPGRRGSVLLSAFAVFLAACQLVLAVGFYYAIQI